MEETIASEQTGPIDPMIPSAPPLLQRQSSHDYDENDESSVLQNKIVRKLGDIEEYKETKQLLADLGNPTHSALNSL